MKKLVVPQKYDKIPIDKIKKIIKQIKSRNKQWKKTKNYTNF